SGKHHVMPGVRGERNKGRADTLTTTGDEKTTGLHVRCAPLKELPLKGGRLRARLKVATAPPASGSSFIARPWRDTFCDQRKTRPTPKYVRQRPSNPHEPAMITGPTIVSIMTPTPPLVRQVASDQSSNASAFSIQPPAKTGPPMKSGSRLT